MSRPIVGTDLQQADDVEYVEGTEFRDDNGIYWRQENDGLCHPISGSGPVWGLSRLLGASTGPVIVTYVPPVPSPHTAPGHYVCSGACAYRFHLREDGLWEGPWAPDGRCIGKGRPMMHWGDLEDAYGDCTRSLVGPVNPAVIRGL